LCAMVKPRQRPDQLFDPQAIEDGGAGDDDHGDGFGDGDDDDDAGALDQLVAEVAGQDDLDGDDCEDCLDESVLAELEELMEASADDAMVADELLQQAVLLEGATSAETTGTLSQEQKLEASQQWQARIIDAATALVGRALAVRTLERGHNKNLSLVAHESADGVVTVTFVAWRGDLANFEGRPVKLDADSRIVTPVNFIVKPQSFVGCEILHPAVGANVRMAKGAAREQVHASITRLKHMYEASVDAAAATETEEGCSGTCFACGTDTPHVMVCASCLMGWHHGCQIQFLGCLPPVPVSPQISELRLQHLGGIILSPGGNDSLSVTQGPGVSVCTTAPLPSLLLTYKHNRCQNICLLVSAVIWCRAVDRIIRFAALGFVCLRNKS
jgi:hypothetical protein